MAEEEGKHIESDPFWSVVRREHPDVDLIVCDGPSPLDPPARVAGQDVQLSDARLIVRGVDDAYASILQLLPSGPSGPSRSWRGPANGLAYVVEQALRATGGASGLDLLRSLARHLHARGWAVEAAGDEQHPHLMATNGWIDLDARSGRAATQLTLAGPVVQVAPDDVMSLEDELVGR